MDLDLRIERLVLPELTAGEQRRLVAALEQELLRLVREQGLPPKLTSLASLRLHDAGLVAIGEDAKPDAIGRRVAAKIYYELAREDQ